MKFDKCFMIEAPQEEVWRFVSDPEKVGSCIPGCQGVDALGDEKYRATVKVQIGPIKTVFNVEFREIEKRPIEFAAYTSRGEEGNRASRVKAESTLSLSAVNASSTQVEYSSELKIVGRLGKFGAGMMKKKADAMGEEFVEALRSAIEGPPSGEVITDAPAPGFRITSRQRAAAIAIAAAAAALLYWFLLR